MAELSRDLRALLFSSLLAESSPPRWSPSADVYRAPGGGWLIKLDLAGVHPADVQVKVQGSRLIVRGSRRDWALQEDYQQQSLEISYSQFERGFELPHTLQKCEISIEFRHGMLLIRIEPKTRTGEERKS